GRRHPPATTMSDWWRCPNDPPCTHGAVLHDITERDDPSPRCCVDGCDCGAVAGSAIPTDAYGCPDGGTCHHDCLAEPVAVCWRTLNAAPLSAWCARWPRKGGMAPVLVA